MAVNRGPVTTSVSLVGPLSSLPLSIEALTFLNLLQGPFLDPSGSPGFQSHSNLGQTKDSLHPSPAATAEAGHQVVTTGPGAAPSLPGLDGKSPSLPSVGT